MTGVITGTDGRTGMGDGDASSVTRFPEVSRRDVDRTRLGIRRDVLAEA